MAARRDPRKRLGSSSDARTPAVDPRLGGTGKPYEPPKTYDAVCFSDGPVSFNFFLVLEIFFLM